MYYVMLCFVLCELVLRCWCDIVFCWLRHKLPLGENKDDLDLDVDRVMFKLDVF